MPCYRCGARQVDPVRGQSPWKRGVRGDQQVLVCPDCQAAHEWTADLDRCAKCGSTRLVRRLGEAECRDCEYVAGSDDTADVKPPSPAAAGLGAAEPEAARSGTAASGAAASGAAASGAAPSGPLAEEVSRALDKLFGRQASAGV
jgi:hypothetical protein